MIIREKQVPVSNLDALLPGQVVERVREALNIKFTQTDHTRCWQHYEVRPPGDSDHPERTKPQFCHWDGTFKRHVYTHGWVNYLARKLADADIHREVLGRDRGPA